MCASFRIRELTSVVQKRFNFPENTVELYAEKVATRGLCAIAQVAYMYDKIKIVFFSVAGLNKIITVRP